jgi:hypothetical protein
MVVRSTDMTKVPVKARELSLPLPLGAFDAAMHMQLATNETRIKRLYVRPRALFAESVVAVLVEGTVVESPGQAWDVEMTLPRRKHPIRIQVKCSGERSPRDPGKVMPAVWGPLVEPASNRGPAPDFAVLGSGFQCDVFVFARHEGSEIERGWHFYVLSQRTVKTAAALHPEFDRNRLLELGAARCEPTDLKQQIAEVVRRH